MAYFKKVHKPPEPPTNISDTYTESEKVVIASITLKVMSADGTAEGWGGYDFQPNNYTGIAEDIFDLCSDHFNFTSR